ncbi:hypothetical protein [Faecalibacter bovis]|uniref:LUD domain-containing protein n=1 Tax=Faecalibacter bovis TaxID=2898187 RepID=A0ABX7XE70_9FLAO|nr:hypothetical protein [Faecalibacter bovis]MBS7333217.1 hypothetical protein [Weeksellaceae bacterium]QTV06146.1 hypothetical protein J9309_02045 [Faecalibacter bovis]
MWKVIKKLLNKNATDDAEENNKNVDIFRQDSSIPEVSLDELFATNFNAGGGHFLYCGNENEALHNLDQIIKYENASKVICVDPNLQTKLEKIGVPNTLNPNELPQGFSFLNCEFLCAYDGSIMISAHQTAGRKVEEFPLNFIIWAKPKQFALNLSDALQKLKSLKKDNLPSNITCIRGKDMHSFSSIPNAKNIYLLLVDDLS